MTTDKVDAMRTEIKGVQCSSTQAKKFKVKRLELSDDPQTTGLLQQHLN
jgi:hypothetical protein